MGTLIPGFFFLILGLITFCNDAFLFGLVTIIIGLGILTHGTQISINFIEGTITQQFSIYGYKMNYQVIVSKFSDFDKVILHENYEKDGGFRIRTFQIWLENDSKYPRLMISEFVSYQRAHKFLYKIAGRTKLRVEDNFKERYIKSRSRKRR